MANTCTICRSVARSRIDSAIVSGQSLRKIGERFGISKSSVDRHKSSCIRAFLAERTVETRNKIAVNIESEMARSADMLNELLVACEEQLIDPVNPDKYVLAQGADQIQVIYRVKDSQSVMIVRQKATLEEILNSVSVKIESFRPASFDPAETMLRANSQMLKHLVLRAKLEGCFRPVERSLAEQDTLELAVIERILIRNSC